MDPRIDIIGIGADGPAGLAPELIGRINAADFLAGGNRHLSYFPEVRGERFTIQDNLAALREEL
jgi:precorrin-6Y C5,15-methyltransferase (decarboxylating)